MIISRSMRASVGESLSARVLPAPRAGSGLGARAADFRRERSRRQDGVRFGERDHPAQFVLQLAHVAGPGKQQQLLHGVFCDSDLALAVFGRRAHHEVVHERGNLVAPLAQRRNLQRDDVEPVEQIFAESSVLHRLFEVGVGRGDHADVDA